MHTPIALAAYVVVIAVLIIARGRLGMFWSTSAFLVTTLVYLAVGFDPALPTA